MQGWSTKSGAGEQKPSSFAVCTAATPHDTWVHPHSVLLAPQLLLGWPHAVGLKGWRTSLDYCVFYDSSAWYTICFALSFETKVSLCDSLAVLGSLCKPGWPNLKSKETCMPLLLSSTGIKDLYHKTRLTFNCLQSSSSRLLGAGIADMSYHTRQ